MESIDEIISLRKDGLREKAIKRLEEYSHANPGNLDMSITLKVWKRELMRESWIMARRDAYHSSSDGGYGEWSRLNEVWSYQFRTHLAKEFLPDIPSPIIARDMVIIPDPSMQAFLGLVVSDGREIVSTSILGARLTYASTPVYIGSSLLFALNGAIYEVSLRNNEMTYKPVLTDKRIQPINYVAPVATTSEVLFTFKGWVLLYSPSTDKRRFIPVELTESDDVLRSPVLWNEEAIFLSRYGERLSLTLNGKGQSVPERMGEPRSDIVCSPPCLVRDRLYFELLNQQGLRGICACNLKRDGDLEMGSIEEGVCSPNDTHLDFPPIAFQVGVLVSSDIEPRLYYVLGEHPLRVVPIDVQIQAGRLRIHQTSHIFSCVLGNRLVGKTPGGLFHFDLLNPREGVIEIFRPKTEVIAQPLNYGKRLFFITRDGARCFTIR